MSLKLLRRTTPLLAVVAISLLFGQAAAQQSDDPFAADPQNTTRPQPADPSDDPSDDPFADPVANPAPPKAPKPTAKPTNSPKRPLATGEEAILAALGEKSSVEFIEAPLEDVVEHLRTLHGIRIHLDTQALDAVGLGSDSPITYEVRDVSLRSVLELILRDLDLTWMIQSEVLMITTPEEAECQFITRVYEVADLVEFRDQNGQVWANYDPLIETIVTCIEPDSWDDVGGPGSVAEGQFGRASVLVTTQTYIIHEKMAKLLDDLRAAGANKPGNSSVPIRNRFGAAEEVTFGMTGRPTVPSRPRGGGGFF